MSFLWPFTTRTMSIDQGLAVFGGDAYAAEAQQAPAAPARPPAAVWVIIAAAAGYGLWRAHRGRKT